jgi:hypothetical protein
MNILKWQDVGSRELSVENIRQLFQPPEDYRISPEKYLPGTEFGGFTRAGRCFIVEGSVRFVFGTDDVTLVAGDVLDFPSGKFSIAVVGTDKLVFVKVWNLRELFRSQ